MIYFILISIDHSSNTVPKTVGVLVGLVSTTHVAGLIDALLMKANKTLN